MTTLADIAEMANSVFDRAHIKPIECYAPAPIYDSLLAQAAALSRHGDALRGTSVFMFATGTGVITIVRVECDKLRGLAWLLPMGSDG